MKIKIETSGELVAKWRAMNPRERDAIRAAIEYGRSKGWKLAGNGDFFTPEMLATGRKRFRDVLEQSIEGHTALDHLYFYRDTYFRPAAIVSHLYDWGQPYVQEQVKKWAQENGLNWKVETDFPSWHNPGRTTMIVYTRKERAKCVSREIWAVLDEVNGWHVTSQKPDKTPDEGVSILAHAQVKPDGCVVDDGGTTWPNENAWFQAVHTKERKKMLDWLTADGGSVIVR
ncbi:hypothetical protein QM996_01175 [Sinorhizobium chiapasense]